MTTFPVGTIVKLKIPCLGNPIGTLGVVFYDYGDGSQVIFRNGEYDGFDALEEQQLFLEKVRFEDNLAGYQFKNVRQVSADFEAGVFNGVF